MLAYGIWARGAETKQGGGNKKNEASKYEETDYAVRGEYCTQLGMAKAKIYLAGE